jgi:hypothetical protein
VTLLVLDKRRKEKSKAVVQQKKRDANQAMHEHPRLYESTPVHIKRIVVQESTRHCSASTF